MTTSPPVSVDLDQPVRVAAPVAREGQRPVDAAGGHLERVGLLAHHVARVQHLGDLPGRVGDVVERDPVVAVDRDPQDPSLAGRGQLHRLDVEVERTQGPLELTLDLLPDGVW